MLDDQRQARKIRRDVIDDFRMAIVHIRTEQAAHYGQHGQSPLLRLLEDRIKRTIVEAPADAGSARLQGEAHEAQIHDPSDFFERSRTEWLRGLGFDIRRMADDEGVLFIVRDLRVTYVRPAVLDDLLGITVAVEHLGRAQFTLFQRALRGQEVLAEASINLACVAAGSFRPLRLPDVLRARLQPTLPQTEEPA